MGTKKMNENQTVLPDVVGETETGKELLLRKQEEERLAKQLDTKTDLIRKEVANVAKGFCKIGFRLWEVREDKLYLAQGFKNVYEYGESVLGFKKATTANYISICEKFSVHKDSKPTLQLAPNYSVFSQGQLSEMLTIPEEKLEEVTPDMKCNDIRKMKDKAASSDSGEKSGDEAKEQKPSAPPISIFERVLTKDNMPIVLKLLHENIGREVSIYVEDNGVYDLGNGEDQE